MNKAKSPMRTQGCFNIIKTSYLTLLWRTPTSPHRVIKNPSKITNAELLSPVSGSVASEISLDFWRVLLAVLTLNAVALVLLTSVASAEYWIFSTW